MDDNFLLQTDSYKMGGHWNMLPPNTQKCSSYLEPRKGGRFPEVTMFGLQYILKKHFLGQVVTMEKILEAEEFAKAHFGSSAAFNKEGWIHILEKHGGRLPLSIRAVPEGMTIPESNVLMVVENTDIEVPWLVGYAETLLVQSWYPTTVATLSRNMKQMILESLERSGDPSLIDFKLHDFGQRSSTSMESAGIGGAAHLVNFKGTDTIPGIMMARNFYGCPMAGFSIAASEHSTICSWGRNYEKDAYENILDKYPTGLVAVVSDSYDIYNACKTIWGEKLKAKVMGRKGTLVVRPDSGVPKVVVVDILKILAEKFGAVKNAKGYLVLDEHVRVIQGDGINYNSTKEILEAIEAAGFSSDNVAFGMGTALLQNLNRDTQKFAFKLSKVVVDSIPYDVFKSPATDLGKASKKGELKLIRQQGGYVTVPKDSVSEEPDILQEVFYNGVLVNEQTFDQIRARAAITSKEPANA